MEIKNQFVHHDYASKPSAEFYELLTPELADFSSAVDTAESLSAARQQFSISGIERIILVHGTMVGTDSLGWYSHWERGVPWLSRKLKLGYKQLVDTLSGDRGNYDERFALAFQKGMSAPDPSESISVARLDWTGENHHLGRADAAVKLCHLLLDSHEADERLMLWGHSHAGNVFAIATQLLQASTTGNRRLLSRFFHTTSFFHDFTGRIDIARWRRLQERLAEYSERSEVFSPVEIITFGTPLRYGWPKSQEGRLQHFVNHAPQNPNQLFRGQWPTNSKQWIRAMKGEDGDFIQLAFIAGSDFPPAYWSRSAYRANRWLNRLFEHNFRNSNRLANLKKALRVSQQGHATLVDYASVDSRARECCGHSVYTDTRWLAFHANRIAGRIKNSR
ncbi:hypothetical protein N9B53_01805 [Mariniblastus sp.]|nr:hypothetical protein [Mariniblastus sp.]